MRKKLAYCSMALCILLLISVFTASSKAADYTKIGVQAGSTADYTFVLGKHVASNSTGTMTTSVVAINNVTVVTLSYAYHYQNGTVDTSYVTGNVSYGSTGGNITSLSLIAANLTVGDKIATGSSWKINNSVYMIVAGANRSLNHFYFASGVVHVYWDKLTGIMTQVRLNFGPLLGWLNLTMTSTNLWSAAGGGGLSTTTLLLIGGVAAVVIIAAAVVLLRRRK